MKKVILSFLCSLMLCFAIAPALKAEAVQMQTTDADVVGAVDREVMPEEEVNPGVMVVGDCFTIGDYTYIPVGSLEPDGKELYVFDEEGDLCTNISLTQYSYGETSAAFVRFNDFAESREFTFALYSDKDNEYVLESAKTITVTPQVWNGNSEVGRISAYCHDNYKELEVYLPLDTDTNDIEIVLFDGERIMGIYEIEKISESRGIYFDGHVVGFPKNLCTNDYGLNIYNSENIQRVEGTLRWGEALVPGKTYTLKACINHAYVKLNEIYCDPAPWVFTVGNGLYVSEKPLISINAEVADMKKLRTDILDPETLEVIGTTAGSVVLPYWDEHYSLEITTDKTKDELTGDIVVDVYYDNKKIDRRWSNYESIDTLKSCYYDHVNREVVIVGSLPKGVTMEIVGKYGLANYEKVVTAEGFETRVGFLKDGQRVTLNEGYHYIECQMTYPNGAVRTDQLTVEVFDFSDLALPQSTSNSWEPNSPYRYAEGETTIITLRIPYIDSWSVANSFYITYQKHDSEEVKQAEAKLVSVENNDGTKYWYVSAEVPVLEVGGYKLEVLRNGYSTGEAYLHILDKDLLYGKMVSIDVVDKKAVMEFYVPGFQELDLDQIEMIAYDLHGDRVEIAPILSNNGAETVYATVELPEDLYIMDVVLVYGRQMLRNAYPYHLNEAYMGRVEGSDKLKLRYIRGGEVYVHGGYGGAMGRLVSEEFMLTSPCTAYIVQPGTMNILKTWDLPKEAVYNVLTAEMVDGLSCADGESCYDIYFVNEKGDCCWNNWYLSMNDLSVVVENGIGKDFYGKACLYIDSKIATDYTGLYYWTEESRWVMICAGYVDFYYTGLVLYDNAWWYVLDGALNTTYTGLVTFGDTQWYVKDGRVDFTYQGLLCVGNDWYYIVNGAVDKNFTGLAFVNNDWWYVVNGKIDFGFTGLASVNNEYWYVVQGKIDFTCTGLVCINNEWYSIEQGRWNAAYNGMLYVNDAWWYVVSGKVDFGFTGLTFVNEKWWYVNQGRIDFTYHGVCEYGGVTYYIENGEINYTASGLVCTGADWYFVENGCVRTDYNGMLFVNDAWWYVVKGQIDFSFSGLFYFNDTWWYVENGRIDFSRTGPIFFADEWWYVENGSVNLSYTGFAFVNEIWWWVIDGKIDFTYCGIQMFNDKYWYIKNAEIDFTYNGTVTGPDGNTYEVVNGEVIGYIG